jgi:hypothetical protein
MTDAERAEINLNALRMAVNWAECPLERCVYVVKDCSDCKANYWLAAAEMAYGEGKRNAHLGS